MKPTDEQTNYIYPPKWWITQNMKKGYILLSCQDLVAIDSPPFHTQAFDGLAGEPPYVSASDSQMLSTEVGYSIVSSIDSTIKKIKCERARARSSEP
jgi:hypothetical protein